MGTSRGYVFYCKSDSTVLTNSLIQANILIDEKCNARLADFGLLTIITESANLQSSSSNSQGGTVRWMSPELITPQQFGIKKSCPTKSSDCYAFGMVIYETISGDLPFHKDTDYTISLKIVKGERPPRRTAFTDHLWGVLETCWAPHPNDRPSIEGVLQCLRMVPSTLDQPSPGMDRETEDDDDWDSGNEYPDTQHRMGTPPHPDQPGFHISPWERECRD